MVRIGEKASESHGHEDNASLQVNQAEADQGVLCQYYSAYEMYCRKLDDNN